MKIKEPLSHNQKLWDKEDACAFLGIGKTKLYEMIVNKELPHLYIGNKLRFIPEQLFAWAKKKTAV